MRWTSFRDPAALFLGAFLGMILLGTGLGIVRAARSITGETTVIAILCALAVPLVMAWTAIFNWRNRERSRDAESRAQAAEDRVTQLDREMAQLRTLVTSLVASKELHDHRRVAELAGAVVSGARLFLDQSSCRN